MPPENYRQCTFRRESDGAFHQAWIPSRYAKVGKKLSIWLLTHWEHDMVVTSVGSAITPEQAQSMYNEQKRFRWVLQYPITNGIMDDSL